MVLSSKLPFLLFPLTVVSGNLLLADRTTRRPMKRGPEEGSKVLKRNRDRQQRSVWSQAWDNHVCQDPDPRSTLGIDQWPLSLPLPLGATYTGKVNFTVNGRTCQAWSSQQPHKHTIEQGTGQYLSLIHI